MYYFDNQYLLQYLLSGASELKVFADDEYYTISSADDLLDPDVGHGYDIYGEHDTFDYKMIDHVMVNGQIFTLAQLQDSVAADEEDAKGGADKAEKDTDKSDAKAADKDSGEDKEDDKEDDKEEDSEPKKEESIQIGDYVKNTDPTHSQFGTKGSVILSEAGYIAYRYFDATSNANFSTIHVNARQVAKC